MKHHRHLSRTDIYALCRLAIVLALLAALFCWLERTEKPSVISPETKQSAQETQQFVSQPERRDTPATLRPVPFNPNTASAAQLSRMGLSENVVRHIVNYRKAGGTFHTPNDLARIYGMKKEHFEALRPYIRLNNKEKQRAQVLKHDTLRAIQTPQKLPATTIVDLNTTDSLQLIQIKGIGPYFAHRILSYRAQLGGYVSPAQLAEIPNFPPEAIAQFRADHAAVKQLNINAATFSNLLRHPYLNYEQVKTICNHRKKFGSLRSIKQLSNEAAFSEADLRKLEPYIAFD